MTARQLIEEQGGRYKAHRLLFLRQTEKVQHRPCDAPGCHGLEGVDPHEAGYTAPFYENVDRLHPGNFPCSACGSTGLVPVPDIAELVTA